MTRAASEVVRPSPTFGHRSHGVESRSALWFAAPAFAVTALLVVLPLVYSLWLALSDARVDGRNGGFVGADNLNRLLQDDRFWASLVVTAQLLSVCLVAETILGLALGVVLSMDVPGQRLLQAVILLPSIMAPVAVGFAWLLILDPTVGLANRTITSIGLPPIAWLGDPDVAPWAIVAVDVWQWTPFFGFIIAAGIRGIPGELLEAAELDRATGVQRLRHIILPLLRPTLAAAVVLRAVDLVRFFDTIYVMTQGGPLSATTTLNVYAYQKAFVDLDPSYGATVQLALLLATTLVAVALWLNAERMRSSAEGSFRAD